ncbi:MAG TPA: hypothetical protein VJ044_17255, partial [Candidatus Hodarchaeales archaeon]|nr:hypothetical protein [Candidatus Hodarchaeales archaeon]
MIDLTKSRYYFILLFVGTAIPAFLCIYFVHLFGVNIPFQDEWQFYPILRKFISGGNWAGDLLSQHNEHRPVFPRMLLLAVAGLTSWNVIYEMYADWILIGISTFVIWIFLRKTFIKETVLIIPIAWVMYSVSQYETLLFGWALQITLMVTSVLLSIYFLYRANILSSRSLFFLALAVVFGYVATFSFINGLIVWIVGTASFFGSNWKKRKFALFAWMSFGILAFAIYFNGFVKPDYHPSYLIFLEDPVSFANFVLAFLGSGLRSGEVLSSEIVGAVTLISFIAAVIIVFRNKKTEAALPWIQIGAFAILSAMLVGVGRLGFGISQALVSHYISISSLMIVATLVISVEVLRELKTKDAQR